MEGRGEGGRERGRQRGTAKGGDGGEVGGEGVKGRGGLERNKYQKTCTYMYLYYFYDDF